MRLNLLSLLFFSITSVFAQDRIQLVTGEDIYGIVLEVGQEIRYRQADFLDGPVYVLLRQEVAMITYENGYEEFFTVRTAATAGSNTFAVRERYLHIQHPGRFYEGYLLISRADFEAKLSTVPAALQNYKTGRGLQVGGYALCGVGLLTTAIGFVSGVSNTTRSFQTPGSSEIGNGTGGVVAGLFLVLGGGVVAAVGVQKVRRALDEYNVSVRDEVGYVPIINANGIGMAMRF